MPGTTESAALLVIACIEGPLLIGKIVP